MGRRLTWRRSDLSVGPVDAALALLGATVESTTEDGTVAVRLTEVEAYGGSDDPGSHAFRGPGRRNATMFGPAGLAYVYFTYGMHWCLNVVCGPDGEPGAVLLRAGEVTRGLDLARTRRPGASDRDLARGPARLTRTLGVTGAADGVDLLDAGSALRLTARAPTSAEVVWGPRVGVAGEGGSTPWRVHLAGDRTVSVYRPATPRRKPTASG
ncbi:MAG: DNA-3-methyladenine glycosylase [Frankiales bacterium]|jgi:DNA-3-methyladenine glycosylase|nr:DNA-3-methyladenine glycosylase [Frankiales bacterium]